MKKNKLIKTGSLICSFKDKCMPIKFVLGLALLCFVSIGCEKEDLEEYYVQYKISTTNIDETGNFNIAVNDKNGEKISVNIEQNTNWETIVGPVTKGFLAKIKGVNIAGTKNLSTYAEIEVSKGSSPFIIKKNDQMGVGVISMELEYKIDF